MGFIFSKKADTSDDADSNEFQDLHSEDMKTRIESYMNTSNSVEERLVALRKIGLFTLTAGPVGEEILLEEFVPMALFDLLEASTPDILRCQLLQTLSIVCGGKARILSSMRKYPNLIRGMVIIMGNCSQPVMARWACYLTGVMISDSPKTMEAFSDVDDLEDNLDLASNMKGSWLPFGGNLAFRLMQLFGFRQPDEEEVKPRSTSGKSKSRGSRKSQSPRRRIVSANAD